MIADVPQAVCEGLEQAPDRVVPRGGRSCGSLGGPSVALGQIPSGRGAARALLALQRTAGNRATTAAIARATTGHRSRSSAVGPEVPLGAAVSELPGQPRAAPAASAARTPRRLATPRLQRFPVWDPAPSWARKDPSQPGEDCQPIPLIHDAYASWAFWNVVFPTQARDMCKDCPDDVGRVWDAYFTATGTPRFHWSEAHDGLTCPIRSLKGDDNHERYEQPVLDAVRSALPSLLPRLRGVSSIRLSLTDAGVPASLLHANPSVGCTGGNAPACLWLSRNDRFGGQLFGKGHESGAIVDSEYGYDTRDVDGTVEITKVPNSADPTRISVRMRFLLNWHLVDAVDFCPGNTMAWNLVAHTALNALSCLEASGMTRDIRVEAEYTRERLVDPVGPFPSPDPPLPTPTHTLPAETLFDFDSARPRTGARAAIEAALGPPGTTFSLTAPVEVVGHTDSVPGPTPDYNLHLSERRADAVRELLETSYPSLRGHIVTRGMGDSVPVAPNDTSGGRAANRRVDITLIETGP
jgi:outer membrane protein OmpA-like peptidoglycan-associated protein